jgi:GR25 family glycosyltransferase involved in LPS biosynthesis
MTHYTPLVERKSRILEHIPFDMKWIESEPEKQCWTTDPESWNKKAPVPFRQISKGEISLGHKHVEVYKDIVANKHSVTLILEDDVILADDFVALFNRNIEQTPKDWDYIFIGSGCGLRINPNLVIPEKIAYKKDHPATKCTDSYCITFSAAKRVLDTIIPFSLPIDFELNYQLERHDMNVYWWEPPIVIQGSQCGLYDSELQG